jgi:hypothetical protein
VHWLRLLFIRADFRNGSGKRGNVQVPKQLAREVQNHIQNALDELNLAQRKMMEQVLKKQAKSARFARFTSLGLTVLDSGLQSAFDLGSPVDTVGFLEAPDEFDQRIF